MIYYLVLHSYNYLIYIKGLLPAKLYLVTLLTLEYMFAPRNNVRNLKDSTHNTFKSSFKTKLIGNQCEQS